MQADSIGCHIITVTTDLLKKLPSLGKDLDQFSVETVQMFLRDMRRGRLHGLMRWSAGPLADARRDRG